MTMPRNPHRDTDRLIRAMMRDTAPDPGADPWFVRRLLNRLPPRRRRIVSLPEIAAFLIVLISSAAIVAVEMHRALILPPSPDFDPTIMLAAAAAGIFATLYISIPIIRRCML